MNATQSLSCFCGNPDFTTAFEYDAPPEGETRFPFPGPYRREVRRCRNCGHYRSVSNMDLRGLYAGAYVDATYGASGLRAAFKRITALPPGLSDNAGRVARILAFAAERWHSPDRVEGPRSVLDVGSGLCVFLHRMKQEGWSCTALDPDPRAAAHARDAVGVRAICGEFGSAAVDGTYDLITFNKVLEHIAEPAPLLAQAARRLKPGGIVYVELPDGEAAAAEGPAREEFFIEHWHAFSPASLRHLMRRAGFDLLRDDRLRDPSGKFTLWAFGAPDGRAGGDS